MATNRVGGEVDALCGRCKLTLAHTIIAMVGDKVVRVQCNTCGTQHAYKGATGTASTRTRVAPGRATPGRSPASRVTLRFDDLLAEKGTGRARRYSPKDTYGKDEVIDHPTFGLGIVLEARADKIDVLFKMAEKTLIHGRGGQSQA